MIAELSTQERGLSQLQNFILVGEAESAAITAVVLTIFPNKGVFSQA
ncbi:MAG: hypothetical protein V7K48_06170 [Nostoc sp.]